MSLILKAKQMFLKHFMTIRFKHFNDSLNIVVNVAPGRELFSECVQFPLTITE